MVNIGFRKLHRKIAPILFIPLVLTALTGTIWSIVVNWLHIDEEAVDILMNIHQGEYLGSQLRPIYVLLVGLGLLGLIVTGLITIKRTGRRPPARERISLKFRKIHRIAAPIIFLPLALSSITGITYRLGRSWFGISREQGEIFLSIHQGEFLGDFFQPIYVLLVGLGLIAMLATGIYMTGIFRGKRSQLSLQEVQTEERDSD